MAHTSLHTAIAPAATQSRESLFLAQASKADGMAAASANLQDRQVWSAIAALYRDLAHLVMRDTEIRNTCEK
jgi:hypothetical protein